LQPVHVYVGQQLFCSSERGAFMLGAILGDIIGSPYEFDQNNIKTTDFPLFARYSHFTDDTVMTLAVAEGLMNGYDDETRSEEELVTAMQKYGRLYPQAGYGARFSGWLAAETPEAYNSYGNGSAMRVSAVGWMFDNLEQVERYARVSARVTHNHPEGIKGAEATAAAVYLARTGKSKMEIKQYLEKTYQYDLNRPLDEIRPNYHHVESCQETVPEAVIAFLESSDFEDAIRKAVSLGGDSDTLAAITGSIAEAFYGIPAELKGKAWSMLDEPLQRVLWRWYVWYYTPFFEKHPTAKWLGEKQKKGTIQIPFPAYDEALIEFEQTFYLSGSADVNYLDTLASYGIKADQDSFALAVPTAEEQLLNAMLTCYIRQERFCDGLITAVENGNIGHILARLKEVQAI
ncbi:MAG: ADP-ribosylglycohydrolase family protein, partial [Desulfosporosinus sp.]